MAAGKGPTQCRTSLLSTILPTPLNEGACACRLHMGWEWGPPLIPLCLSASQIVEDVAPNSADEFSWELRDAINLSNT